MRRVEGTERGAGEWERVSWDEAIQEIASHMQAAIDQYGGSSIVFDAASGNYGYVNGIYGLFPRLSLASVASRLLLATITPQAMALIACSARAIGVTATSRTA